MKKFTLPDKWHIVVNKNNAEDVLKWRFENSYSESDKETYLTYIVGFDGNTNSEGISSKAHNPNGDIKDPDGGWDFGESITYSQFKKHVLGIKSKRQKYKYLIPILEKLNLENNENK